MAGLSQLDPASARKRNIGVGERGSQLLVGLLERGLASLERDEHRKDREDRILGLPRLRRGAKHQVLERRRAQLREPGVDAARIGVEQRLPLRIRALVGLLRNVTETMDASLRVHLERASPDERGQLARRLTPLQVHLEETILRVHEAQRARQVHARRCRQAGHTQRVACDGDGCGQPGERKGTLERGQAGAQLGAQIHSTRQHHQDQRSQHHDEAAEQQPSHQPIIAQGGRGGFWGARRF